MTEYLVEWTIELDARSPEGAARKAREIQLNPESIANVFRVYKKDSDEPIEIDIAALDSADELLLREGAKDGKDRGMNGFGYPAPGVPCRVCGQFMNNQMESRFGYVVCELHQSTPPSQILGKERS